MKKNSVIVWIRIVLLTIVCILLVINGFFYAREKIVEEDLWAFDCKLRHNEISCIQTGVDPFDIFERKIESEEFYGFPRPDKPRENKNGRKIVHTYPAWHMPVFWWYGYVPTNVCIAFMIGACACSLVWICIWTSKRIQTPDRINLVHDILFLLAMTLYPFSNICWTLNYGLILLGCSLLLYTALEYKRDILAGIIYSFIMIKPQIGVLFFFPLLIGKKYKTIVIAGVICILETLFTAWQLDKSPVELILQLPQIGAPFHKGFFANIAIKIFGSYGQYISIGGFVVIVVVGCFLVRNAKDIWVRFLPAVACIPFWTYSHNHDWLVALTCFLYILRDKNLYPRLYNLCFCLVLLWPFSIISYDMKWYIFGEHKPTTPVLLLILSSSFLMAVLDEKNNWNININVLKNKE